MTVSAQAQATFHKVIISGIGKIFGVALVSLSFVYIWGLNRYVGKLYFALTRALVLLVNAWTNTYPPLLTGK